jgi:F420-dependent oxidoreductase-like protein
MKLGLLLGYAGKRVDVDMAPILSAERAGFDSVWTAEAYGSDAVSMAAWVLAQTTKIKVGTAIMQMPARSPACTAGTAITLSQLSGGRFLLGLGPSGPQVVEGWHGVAYGKPLTRTREYISIIRQILAREAPLEHEGAHYQIPYRGPGSTGLGKALKSIVHPDPELPIYTASISPAGLRCAAEVADGVIPVWMNPERFDLFEKPLQDGFDAAGNDKSLERFDIAPFVSVSMGDDLDICRAPVKGMLSLYVGGMGAKGKNFYNDYAVRLGYEEAAEKIQDHFLAGRKMEAMAAVPDELVDEVALVGPRERIRERLGAWKQAGERGQVGSMLVAAATPEVQELLAEELL